LCIAEAGVPGQLDELAGQMEEAGRVQDWFTVARLDRAFHRSIVDSHGNSILTELYDALRSRQQRVAVRALQIRPQRVPEIDRQHRAIISALTGNDIDGVAALLDEHLRPIPEITAALG
jgi:DNA-binding GntR family transcriptional regulator